MASDNGGSILMYMYIWHDLLPIVRTGNDKVAHDVKSSWEIAKLPADKLNR